MSIQWHASEIKEQWSQFKRNKKEFKNFIATITDERLRSKVQAVHTYAYLKTDRIDTWRKIMCHTRGFYEYLSTLQEGYSIGEAVNLSVQEVAALLQEGQAPSLSHMKIRSSNHALYFYHDGYIEVVTNKRIIDNTFQALEGDLHHIRELKGVVACKGKVTGRAKIITHSDDLTKIEDGDIFVAKYTFPNFTPYMLKSAAIVTDEGGITSHAAILSREYNKPCVINTKRATSLLKDGDLVEVDATKGIVTIVQKQK